MHPPALPLADAPITTDTSLLQAHVLHLSLFHASFEPAFRAYCESARQSLRSLFSDIADRAAVVQEQERHVVSQSNLVALAVWGGGPQASLGEYIQVLAAAIQELDVILDPRAGRVPAVVDLFSDWIVAVSDMYAMRAIASSANSASDSIVHGLGAPWVDEVGSLIRRLRAILSMLDALETPLAQSSMATMLALVRETATGTVEELELVAEVERLVGARENEWIESRLQQILDHVELDRVTA